MPEPQVWAWLVQLLLSLSYIHSKRILHRDVKTQNIFLSGGKVRACVLGGWVHRIVKPSGHTTCAPMSPVPCCVQ